MNSSELGVTERKFAFVLPRFGEDVIGGAETLAGNLARHVAEAGNSVEIFTTCARDNRSWKNELPAGTDHAYGLSVRRFPVNDRDLEKWIPSQLAICEGMMLPLEDQLDWMADSVNSTPLYQHIAKECDSFDALIFAPYLFGTTFWGSLICPEKSVLIPCLHDEAYAYTDVVQSMFRQVRGALFNALPEQELAQRLYGEIAGGEVGMGFDPLPEALVAGLSPYFEDEFPYMVYIGRKETGKNVQTLIDYFIALKDSGSLDPQLRLVIAGGGDFSDIERPGADQRADIVDLPPLSSEEKMRLIKHATVLCQPSLNESFSIVLMEAWQLGTPVLVHAQCAVTKHQVLRSGGGLYFADQLDFGVVMRSLLEDPDLCMKLAAAGECYVGDYYSWPAVMKRFDAVMGNLLGQRQVPAEKREERSASS